MEASVHSAVISIAADCVDVAETLSSSSRSSSSFVTSFVSDCCLDTVDVFGDDVVVVVPSSPVPPGTIDDVLCLFF